ncbi:hypothetical protein ACFQV2_23235 [Actinokineospora soli]|uniref:FMN reductase n=1 Tax=Actinokineospora soli TaxID=1048753 RepID=A0ABW2TRN2_9PSEU
MAILILSGGSATASAYAGYAAARLPGARAIGVRDLPTRALLCADRDAIADLVPGSADAVVVVAAVRRASTSGLLKALVELLDVDVPALPVAVGAFPAHARVLDHALLPALGPHVLPTVFLPDHHADLTPLDAALDRLAGGKTRGSAWIAAASVAG